MDLLDSDIADASSDAMYVHYAPFLFKAINIIEYIYSDNYYESESDCR